jgi:transposase
MLNADVHPASVQDRDGGPPLLKDTRKLFPFLTTIIADAAYQGPRVATALAAIADWQIEIVRRADVTGFKVLPKRWIVERTFAWLGRCRRLAKDFENLARIAMAFLWLASIRLLLRRLTRAYP